MRQKQDVPSYTLHKSTGQARVRVDGKDYYLGPYGSKESRVAYGQLIAKIAGGIAIGSPAERRPSAEDSGPTVGRLLVAYWKHAQTYYRKPDGTPTSEIDCLKYALRPLRIIYGMTPAAEFTPLMLKAVRDEYIRKGWTRKSINKHVCRVRSVFRWGVENGLVPESVLSALKALAPLSQGRSAAKEGRPRLAVSDDDLNAVRGHLRQRNRDIVDLLLLTGARPSELLSLKWEMVDQSSNPEVWSVELKSHKTAHLGRSRKLFFGSRAQMILNRYSHIPPNERIFPSRRDSLSKAVAAACDAAGVPRFVPHQLRHTKATMVRDEFGIEMAQAMLGHATPDMTAHYSARMDKLAIEAARKSG